MADKSYQESIQYMLLMFKTLTTIELGTSLEEEWILYNQLLKVSEGTPSSVGDTMAPDIILMTFLVHVHTLHHHSSH
jgi:hypothetical protein